MQMDICIHTYEYIVTFRMKKNNETINHNIEREKYFYIKGKNYYFFPFKEKEKWGRHRN